MEVGERRKCVIIMVALLVHATHPGQKLTDRCTLRNVKVKTTPISHLMSQVERKEATHIMLEKIEVGSVHGCCLELALYLAFGVTF